MESLYNLLHVYVKMFGLIEKKKEFHAHLCWTNTPVQEAKRRASFEFCVHLDMSEIGIVCFTKRCLGFSKFRILKVAP